MKKTYKAGLIGKRLKNSYSKEIYTQMFDKIEYKNYVIKTQEELDGFFEKKDFDFVNITNPYKKTVIPYLDKISKTVKETGVCNLVIKRKGILSGYNTDCYGFKMLLKKHKISIENKNILILGNGATSESVLYVINKQNPKSVVVACRNPKNENQILFQNIDYNSPNIIINTTPVGNKKSDQPLINIKNFKNLETFIDVIYEPYRTPTMIDAKNEGKGTVGGLTMLIYQALLAHNFAKGSVHPLFFWEDLRLRMFLWHTNLVFIGMPTAGKTETCKKIKDITHKNHLDTDKTIETLYKAKIRTIIKKTSLENFRAIEVEMIKYIQDAEGLLISTGGGTVMNEENYRRLARKGYFIYLKKTNFDDFIDDKKRPLIKSKEDLKIMYKERNPIYEKVADLTVSCDLTPEEVFEEVTNAIVNS